MALLCVFNTFGTAIKVNGTEALAVSDCSYTSNGHFRGLGNKKITQHYHLCQPFGSESVTETARQVPLAFSPCSFSLSKGLAGDTGEGLASLLPNNHTTPPGVKRHSRNISLVQLRGRLRLEQNVPPRLRLNIKIKQATGLRQSMQK